MKRKTEPKVSVVMAEYNTHEKHLRESINSIVHQTFLDFEFIIVDDCGFNDVDSIVREFADSRIRVIKNSANKGLVYSLNRAIKDSKSEYIVRMDTDDIARSNRIKVLFDFAQAHPKYSVVGSRAMQFSESGNEGVLGKPGNKTKESIAKNDSLIHPSVIMRKSDIIAAGMYPNFKRAEDFALWCELLLKGRELYVVDEALLEYRVNRDDYSKRRLLSRIGEIKARLYYYRRLRIKPQHYATILKSVIAGLLPIRFVRYYRRKLVLETVESRREVRYIKVLHVVGGMNMGGAETFLMNLLRNIDRNRFQFVFLCYGNQHFDYEDEALKLGAKIVRVASARDIGVIRHTNSIRRIIKDEDIDIVHSHIYYSSIFSILAAKLSKVKVRIVHSHNTQADNESNVYEKIYNNFSKLLINLLGTRLIACGEDAGKALFFKSNTFEVIHNGIDLNNFTFDLGQRKLTRRQLNISDEENVILHVGRFNRQKNHAFLIEVFNSIVDKNPSSILLLVGDGPLKIEIEKKVSSLKLANRVIFLGKRSDMSCIYNASDALLLPSLFEGLPVTLVEAQANGLRCLVSNAVDHSSKLTRAVEFFPLSKTHSEWAKKINSMDRTRVDTSRLLVETPYNILVGVKTIETLYADSLEIRE